MLTRNLAIAVVLCAAPVAVGQEFAKTLSATIDEVVILEKKIRVGNRWYRVPSDCPVTLDTKKSSIEDLKEGQQANITFRVTYRPVWGLAERIEAVSVLKKREVTLLSIPKPPELPPLRLPTLVLPQDRLLDFSDLKVNSKGKIDNAWTFRIVQVIDGDNMLVSATHSILNLESRIFWLKGVSTGGLADKEDPKLRGWFKVTGTKQYTNVQNATSTVKLLEPESEQEAEKRHKDEERVKATLEAEYRTEKEKRIAEHNREKESRAAAYRASVEEINRKNKAMIDDADKDYQAQKQAMKERKNTGASEEKSKAEVAPDKREKLAATKLELIRQLIGNRREDVAKVRLKRLIKDYEGTQAAKKAKELLDSLP